MIFNFSVKLTVENMSNFKSYKAFIIEKKSNFLDYPCLRIESETLNHIF